MTAAEWGPERTRSQDEAAMWCDLLLAHVDSVSARHRVTKRAELYVRLARLPLHQVLDALHTDEAGWAARLAEVADEESRNRLASQQWGSAS